MQQITNLKDIYEKYVIACISKQCDKTKKHINSYRSVFANNRQSAGFTDDWKQITFALCADKAEGAYLYDMDGNKYLDLTMGFGVHLFGHSPVFIKEVILQQLSKGISLGPICPEVGETAKMICSMTKNDRCAFFNSGTEAVMVALRLARARTGKNKIVVFEGAYHGTHESVLVMKYHPATQEAIANVPGITSSMVQDTILLKFGDLNSLRFIHDHASEIAAIITEPVRSRFPEEVNPAFLNQLDQVCKENKIAFILDEVITGFRIGNGGAKHLFGLDPDIVTYGKVLGGGLPIGVVAGKKEYLNYIDGGVWSFYDNTKPTSPTTFVAGTFCHNPLSIAATHATLTYLIQQNGSLQRELNDSTKNFCEHINKFCDDNNIPAELAHYGSMFRFLVKGKSRLLYHALLKEKVYIWEGRTCFLSTAHSDIELSILEARIKKCLIEMKAAKYFHAHETGDSVYLNEVFLQAGISIDEVLNEEWLQLAFYYTCENINIFNGLTLHKEFLFSIAAAESVNADKINNDVTADIRLTVLIKNDKTQLMLQAVKSLFDGWSLIILLSYIGKCYAALESKKTLPENVFDKKELIENWLGSSKIKLSNNSFQPASTIHSFLPLSDIPRIHKGSLFEYLLASFSMSLGKGEHVIGVPVSGQLISRLFHSVGNYTCQAPVKITISPLVKKNEIIEQIAAQLKPIKKSFNNLYFSTNSQPMAIVFNIDNLSHDFLFANRNVVVSKLTDPYTSHQMVVNVVVEPRGLQISIKYRAGESAEVTERIMKRFCSSIIESENVYT